MSVECAQSAFAEILRLVGPLWPLAWAGAFVVMALESSKPKAADGEETAPNALSQLGALCSAAVPFLLALHGFGAFVLENRDRGPLSGAEMAPVLALFFAVGVLVIAPALIGAAVGRLAPAFGRAVHGFSRVLAVAVFVFAIFVTWRNVFMVLDLFVLTRLSGV